MRASSFIVTAIALGVVVHMAASEVYALRPFLAMSTAAETTVPRRPVQVHGISLSREATSVSGFASVKRNAELTQARACLNRLIVQYPILAGTTVEFGDARGYQAIAYMEAGRIVISPTHTQSIERLLGHEVWHIIDWRDNHHVDWGENVPPKDYSP